MERKYSTKEIADYISGWVMGKYGEVQKIGEYAMRNALSQLEDEQDGIKAVVERKEYYDRLKNLEIVAEDGGLLKITRGEVLDYLLNNTSSIKFRNSCEYSIDNAEDLVAAGLQEECDEEERRLEEWKLEQEESN